MGKFYEDYTKWKRVELNENEMRNDLNRYIANNQPKAYKKFPIINGTNFFKFLELAKNDDSIFTYFTQKSMFAIGRNRRVKEYLKNLYEIKELIDQEIAILDRC